MSESLPAPAEATLEKDTPETERVVSASEIRAKRSLIIGGIVAAIVFLGMTTLLVWLSVRAYDAALLGTAPDPGEVVVSLLRDAAIIMVAFETMVIGALLAVLTFQVWRLVVLLQDEIKPMLESLNETVATVRGTTLFVSENVVSPTIRAAGFMSGLRRVLKEIADLVKPS